MIHEIINPSDPYTIECDDMALLTASIFVLGEGKLGTSSEETDFTVPITIFLPEGGAVYFENEFNIDFESYVETNKVRIGECLGTVVLGKVSDRDKYFEFIKNDDKDEREKLIEKWYDENETSSSQLGQRALYMYKYLAEGKGE